MQRGEVTCLQESFSTDAVSVEAWAPPVSERRELIPS